MSLVQFFVMFCFTVTCWMTNAVAVSNASCSSPGPSSVVHGSSFSQSQSIVVLAHYMPWYTAKPFGKTWGWHWTMNQFDPEKKVDGRRQIASKYYPLIGPYDSGDPAVLEYHLLLMKQAGIDGVIVDWYGLTDFRDYAILHRNTTRLLQQCERLKMKFVICYEDQTIPALVKGRRIKESERVAHAVKEIDWLGKYWFQSPSYLKWQGKPVLLSFGHVGLTGKEWPSCLKKLKEPVAYMSQDIRREGAMGGFGWPAPKVGLAQVDRFLKQSKRWPTAMPAAFPRFDDIYRQAKVSEGYPRLPDQSGQTLRMTLRKAIESRRPWVQIATWNDWGEGTQVEPSNEFRYRDLKIVRSQLMKTKSQILPQQTQKNHPELERKNHERKNDELKSSEWELPFQLYQARKSRRFKKETLDEISKLIRQGKYRNAKSRLER